MAVNCKKCALHILLHGQAYNNGRDNVLSPGMIRMSKHRAEQVKMQNTPIPFLHPHTEPYRYLGVDLTPTFNWAPHVDRILKETKKKGESLLASVLSPQQKILALHTVIDSYAKYSFPLACMTFSDVQKLDMIRTRICKKVHKIPLCTPSAMIHQDRECAGVGLTSLAVPYTEMVCKYLTQALNDNGSLGFTTRALLILQNTSSMRHYNTPPARDTLDKHHIIMWLAS